MADAERTLSQRELNRALLARQMLLERASLSLPRAVERMGLLQAQYAPSMYIGLWARLEGLGREQVTKALERRTVVQGTMMRATIHLASKRDYWPIVLAVRRARRESWLSYSPRRGYSAKQMAAHARRLRRELAKGQLSRKEIHLLLGEDSVVTNGVNMWLDLVRIPPSGTWERRRADLYAAADDWLGPPEATREQGVELLIRRYLGAFGPAPVADIANWAGLPPKQVVAALGGLRLRRFRDERGKELVDLPRAPLPDPDGLAPVRFIPTFDAILLVHARRTGVLPEQHRPKVFNTRTPQSVNTFLVNGEVAGTWREEKGKIAIEPFGKLDRETRRELYKRPSAWRSCTPCAVPHTTPKLSVWTASS
ncbi:MAG: winged helix DNA-binding domain-containing protein [Solirubrobacterales bacterium]